MDTPKLKLGETKDFSEYGPGALRILAHQINLLWAEIEKLNDQKEAK